MHALNRVEILKAGEFIDGAEKRTTVTKSDLRELASTYEPALAEAPVLLGHSSDDIAKQPDSAPSFGWLKQVYVDGDSLYADLDITDAMQDLLKSGYYKKRSIAYYGRASKLSPAKGKLYIRHLAMLGARAPAVKGLEDIKLSEPEYLIMNEAKPDNKQLLNQKAGEWLRFVLNDGVKGYPGEIVELVPEPAESNNWLFAKEGEIKGQFIGDDDETYNFSITKGKDGSWTKSYRPVIQSDEEAAAIYGYAEPDEEDLEASPDADVTAPEPESVPVAEPEPEKPAAPSVDAEVAKLQARLAELEASNKELADELAEKREGEISAMADKYYSEGKLTEAIMPREALINLLGNMDKQSEIIEFSESKTCKAFDILTSMLDKLPAIVQFGEFASQAAGDASAGAVAVQAPPYTVLDEASTDVHKKVISYCKSNDMDYTNLSQYRQALKKVV